MYCSGLISSIVRFAIFFDTQGFIDGTWTSANLMIWTAVEPGVYHLAACLPTIRPLVLLLIKNISTTIKSGRSRQYGDQPSVNTKDIQLVGRDGAELKGAESRGANGFVRLGSQPDAEKGRYSASARHNVASNYRDDVDEAGLSNVDVSVKDNRSIVVTQDYIVSST